MALSKSRGLRLFINISFLFLAAGVLLPVTSSAQKKDEDATTFPLENFYAKIKKSPRSVLKNIKFGFTTGYGSTAFSHELAGFGIYQVKGKQPTIFDGKTTNPRFSNWVNNVSAGDTAKVKPGNFLVSSDSAKLGFKGHAFNIPFKATIHYEWGRYRIGGGYSYELMSMGSFHTISYSDKISDFQPAGSTGWMSKYFGLVGVSFYRIGNYLFTGDVQVGGFKPGSNFNASLVQTGIYVNGGVTVERELSEYLRLVVRPSYEMKSYTLTLPEGGKSINHSVNAFYINVGISYTIPELPKCFIPDCKIQMNHAHGDTEYRSRVHPFYKKQNPQYGENHPNLIKYKGKNKKRLNPY